MSVDEFGSNFTANKIKSGETFDAIIHLGFSSKSTKIRFEKYAYNEYKMSKSDNSGRCISNEKIIDNQKGSCLLYTSPSPRDGLLSRMPSSA